MYYKCLTLTYSLSLMIDLIVWYPTELIEEAAKRWRREEGDYRDDITAIVVRLPLPQVEEEVMESSM